MPTGDKIKQYIPVVLGTVRGFYKHAVFDNLYNFLIERVGATLVCAYSDKSESEKLDNTIIELGY